MIKSLTSLIKPLILATATVLVTSCGSNLTKIVDVAIGNVGVETNYKPPKNTVYDAPIFNGLSKKELLERTIDNTVALELLNPDYVAKMDELVFKLTPRKQAPNGDAAGSFGEKYRVVKIHSDTEFGEGEEFIGTLIHELAHDYWHNSLTEQQKREFRKEGARVIRSHIKPMSNISTRRKLSEEQNKTIETFLSTRDYYENYYDKMFLKQFYGTELYSFMVDISTTANRMEAEHKNPSLSNGTSNSLKAMPETLLSFYKGFLHPRFFESENP